MEKQELLILKEAESSNVLTNKKLNKTRDDKEEKGSKNNPRRSLSVPEKIIIAIDKAVDEECTKFIDSGTPYTPLALSKKAVQIFVHNKISVNSAHQFGLMALNETNVEWLHNFTSSPSQIINSLKSVKPCKSEDIFNLNNLFDCILSKININMEAECCIPNFVVRLIIIYSRSYTKLSLEETEEIKTLLSSPYFTVDCIYSHEPFSSANHSEIIFEQLNNLDKKDFSYTFSTERNANSFYNSMAKLIGNPLQRSLQEDINYTLSKCVTV